METETVSSHLATKPREVGRAVPSAPRRFRLHSICAVFVNSIGALGTARPTFWLSCHLGNRPLRRLLQWPGPVALLALGILSGLWPAVAAEPAGKEELLRNVVQSVIRRGYDDLADKSHKFAVSAEDLNKTSTEERLESMRQSWKEALLAARRIQWLQSGPIADREYLAAFYYSKVLPFRMEEILNSSRPIDDAYVGQFGPNARGMFAIEYLLFRPGKPSAPASARRNQYLLVLAHDLESKAAQIAKDWAATGEPEAAAKFVAAGQQSVGLLVNQISQFIEQTAEQRLNFVLALPPPISSQLDRIEGGRSHISQQSAVEALKGVQRLYRGSDGNGIEGYLKRLNAPLAERLAKQFEATVNAAETIGSPLEQAAVDNRLALQRAYETTRALEILLKTDLTSALGVTLTFTSNDGD